MLLSIKEAVNDSLAAPFVSFLITVSDWFGLWFFNQRKPPRTTQPHEYV
jgi:hypothetical protein